MPSQSLFQGLSTTTTLILVLATNVSCGTLNTFAPEDAKGAFAVETVTVGAGGHPVREVDSGLVFQQSFDDSCSLRPDTSAPGAAPLAATAATRIELDVKASGCSTSVEPTVQCTWAIEVSGPPFAGCRENPTAATTDTVSWTGLESVIDLPVPSTTGVYDLSLDCRLEGGEIEGRTIVNRSLFVTLDAPLLLVTPPSRDWYRHASCWGAGFATSPDEPEVVEALLDGLYRYGQRNWLYGYASSHEPPRLWLFNGHEVTYVIDTGEFVPRCYGKLCKCSWEAMVAEDSPCNFADCYVYSRSLQHVAASLGIGGLIECQDCQPAGELGIGFVTPTDAVALDPRFESNIDCGLEEGKCPSYLFSAHSLLWKENQFYDATFNRVYDSVDDVRMMSVRDRTHHVQLVETESTLLPTGSRYGGWGFYHYPAPTELLDPNVGPYASFTDTVEFSSPDDDSDGLAEALKVTFEIELARKGEVVVIGTLSKDGANIADRPDWWTPHRSSVTVHGGPGKIPVKLTFSGEEIYRSRQSGQFQVALSILDKRGVQDRTTYTTPELRFGSFGELELEVKSLGARLVDTDTDGTAESLEVTASISERVPQGFFLEVWVGKDGKTVASLGKKCESGECSLVTLTKKAALDPEQAGEGSYLLTGEVFNPKTLVSLGSHWLEIQLAPTSGSDRSGDRE